MNVLSDSARRHERVEASLSSDTTALHAPKGGGRGAEDGHGGGNDLDRRHCRGSASIVSKQRVMILG